MRLGEFLGIHIRVSARKQLQRGERFEKNRSHPSEKGQAETSRAALAVKLPSGEQLF